MKKCKYCKAAASVWTCRLESRPAMCTLRGHDDGGDEDDDELDGRSSGH